MDSRSDGYPPDKANEKGLSLSCKIDDDVPELLVGDPVRFTQVISNLLSNAVVHRSGQGIGEYILPFYE